ncbi:HAD family phosphatase [Amycolatopsis sp. QT-25]|uniref:HAD family hydrolase n=1 Tax=Amycolatopsis sp. QT-25 TaxID=3034022 RepID=UPI0023EC31BC|nr:HAD family phosphatase [Amycolatopsis sp. QT-25]WET82881.1 HAD family phosphatase [Amycolatopsis sp. QT-25]
MTEPSTPDGLAAVLWDMDGTLVDSEKLWDVALYETVETLGGTLTGQQRLSLVGSNMDDTAAFLLEVCAKPVTPESIAEMGKWIRERTANLFDGPLPWRPGARELLELLRANGVPMALVTSTERSLTELALDTIGREYFAATVCGDEVDGLNKPDARPYQLAAELLGVPASRCVAIEDSPPGAASAVAAGCTVVVIPNDVDVAPGERRVFRSSLVGLDVPALTALLP